MYHGNVRMVTQYIASIKAYAIEGELASRRVFEVMDEYPKENFGDKELKDIKGEIVFSNVSFGYDENKNILNDVNILFEPNKSTAIVGRSGSGKSTILALTNRLYDLNSGQILIDGIDIKDLTEDSLRNNIGIVTQSPYIFNSTIKENLLLVSPKATDEEIILALKRAEIYDFVEKLPDGLDSKVGENGVMLSGGQKQRLAISRILLKNSKIIVLDEATSSLDNENQNKIVSVIDELKKDHTIIIVAHRLSTILDVDQIIVIDNGKIVEQGTHKQLMKKCKIYRDLYEKEEKSSFCDNLK
jgi:ATP-binding cassette subfamily B protein